MSDQAFTQSQIVAVLVWGGIATAVMTTVTEGAQLLGLSRMSLPFLFGTCFSGRRNTATVLGFILYGCGGLVFAVVYFLAFETIGGASWWLGTVLGFGHGLFLIAVLLPLMPYVHPRIPTEYDGPSAKRRLEPPGPFGLNYGRRTPLFTVLGQTLYGAILGAAWSFQ